ncbi:MAG TPA: hypothetical protein PKE45_14675 [Caldilineaceae bacterium]|nr:hypothetical protein [Caldilineaceae bacterium]
MIVLQIYFELAPDQAEAFQAMYRTQYAPALQKQQGYLSSRLLQLFPAQVAAEIEADPTPFTYQMELVFDNEANRRRWAASAEHSVVWPLASAMARSVAWRGYDVVGSDAK